LGKWCAGDSRGVAERPVGLRGAGQRAVVGFGAFCEGAAMAARRFRSIRRKMQFTMIPIFKKMLILGDSYLRKSAEFS